MTLIFKNIEVTGNDVGDFMKDYTEQNKLLSGARWILIDSYKGKNSVGHSIISMVSR